MQFANVRRYSLDPEAVPNQAGCQHKTIATGVIELVKAAVCHEFGAPFELEDIVVAQPGDGEVAVRIKACAVCHSDIIFADGGWGGDLPAVYGHEASGIVESLGPGVNGLAVGDRVIVTMVRSCGSCPCCARGLPGSCETSYRRDNESPLAGTGDRAIHQGLKTAAFAEKVLVDQSQLVRMDDAIGFDRAALLACGVITGYGAVANTAKIEPGCDVVVIGAGGVGLNSVQGASILKAGRIIAVDIDDERLAIAREFGATHGVNSRTQDVNEAISHLTEGRGADYVFVTVGLPAVIDLSVSLLAPGGSSVLVGIPASGATAHYDPVTLASSSQRILGSKVGESDIRSDLPHLMALYRQGILKLDELISGHFPLAKINEAMAAARSGKGLRYVVTFDGDMT